MLIRVLGVHTQQKRIIYDKLIRNGAAAVSHGRWVEKYNGKDVSQEETSRFNDGERKRNFSIECSEWIAMKSYRENANYVGNGN